MPDNTPEVVPAAATTPAGFPDAAAHNATVAAKLASQDMAAPGNLMKDADFNTGNALDKLAAQVPDPNAPKPEPTAEETAAAKKAADEAAAKAADETAAKAADEEAKKKSEELFSGAPPLPADASPKAKDSFAAIKVQAAKEISALQAERDTLRTEKAALEEKVKNKSPEHLAIEKEAEELRLRLAKLDVDVDPKFKEFDTKIKSSHEFIYAQLRTSPKVNEDTIKKIQELGGPENVNLSKLFEAIADPTLQRIVESKVADIAVAKFEKDQAVKATKDNVAQYLQERQQLNQKAAESHVKATTERANQLLNALDWYKPQAVDPKATPEQKQAADSYNKFLTGVQTQIKDAFTDTSPEMHAILITGTAELFNAQRIVGEVRAELETTKKSLADITAKYEKIRAAGRTRLPESQAPVNGKLPNPKPVDTFNQRPGDALDALAKQVGEKRQAAGIGA
jgi:hypothetical protein